MDENTRRELIDKYKAGYAVVAEVVSGATDEELDRRAASGKWSAREIAHHLADSEMTAAVRLRLLVGEDRPAIAGYDQDKFSRRLHYDRPIAKSLEAFKAARDSTAELLDCLTPDDWRREGTHSEMGRYSVEIWLQVYAGHAHKHAGQMLVAMDAEK
jgi:DinB superfamily